MKRGEGGHTAWTTDEFDRSPLKKVTLPPEVLASTTCPPVTLVKSWLVNRVGTNALVLVTDAGMEPFRTWYCRTAVSNPSLAVNADNVSLPTRAKASLEGARMVMFCALLRP